MFGRMLAGRRWTSHSANLWQLRRVRYRGRSIRMATWVLLTMRDSYPGWIRRQHHRHIRWNQIAEGDAIKRLPPTPRIRLGSYWSLPPLRRWRGRVLN